MAGCAQQLLAQAHGGVQPMAAGAVRLMGGPPLMAPQRPPLPGQPPLQFQYPPGLLNGLPLTLDYIPGQPIVFGSQHLNLAPSGPAMPMMAPPGMQPMPPGMQMVAMPPDAYIPEFDEDLVAASVEGANLGVGGMFGGEAKLLQEIRNSDL